MYLPLARRLQGMTDLHFNPFVRVKAKSTNRRFRWMCSVNPNPFSRIQGVTKMTNFLQVYVLLVWSTLSLPPQNVYKSIQTITCIPALVTYDRSAGEPHLVSVSRSNSGSDAAPCTQVRHPCRLSLTSSVNMVCVYLSLSSNGILISGAL